MTNYLGAAVFVAMAYACSLVAHFAMNQVYGGSLLWTVWLIAWAAGTLFAVIFFCCSVSHVIDIARPLWAERKRA